MRPYNPSVNVSRRARTCDSCRKIKRKCHWPPGSPEDGGACNECRARNKVCRMGISIESWVVQIADWNKHIKEELESMREAITALANEQNQPSNLVNLASVASEMAPRARVPPEPPADPVIIVQHTEQLPSIPGKYLQEATENSFAVRSIRDTPVSNGGDLIDKGLIQLTTAEQLFDLFKRLDQYVYGLSMFHSSLQSMRQSSSLLTACVCAVAALHEPQYDDVFEVAESEFKELLKTRMFSRTQSQDDMLAMVVASFWLRDACFALSSLAVPFAYDLNVEPAFEAFCRDSTSQSERLDSYRRIRLWYMVFVSDHQLSIPYGRWPATRINAAVRYAHKFRDSAWSCQNDLRMVAQVGLWMTLDLAADEFGCSGSLQVPATCHDRIRQFLVELDQSRIENASRYEYNALIGNYPAKGAVLHYHFAKMYLCLMPLRGVLSQTDSLDAEHREFSDNAMLSAQTIIKVIVGDTEVLDMIIGLPLYFHTMICFATVFLLKATALYPHHFQADYDTVSALVDKFVTLLQVKAAAASKHHIIQAMATGLRKALHHMQSGENEPADLWTSLLDETFPIAEFDALVSEMTF